MDNLPGDILLEILLLLPVKSVLGLKLVCKSWRSHISNPEFVKQHVLRTMNNPNNDLFIVDPSFGVPYTGKLFVINVNVNFLDRSPISLNIPTHVSNDIGDFDYVVGSCNGLLCLAYECNRSRRWPRKLYLWNPVTKQVKDISRYTIDQETGPQKGVVSFGFDFDHATSDYKVVRIVQVQTVMNRVEVYSLNANSWKEIEVEYLEFGCIEGYCVPATADGSIYWTLERRFEDSGVYVLSFDVQSQKFSKILVPDDSLEDVLGPMQGACDVFLFEFKESIAIRYSNYHGGTYIYTLDNDNCWIKKLNTRSIDIVGCLKTGEFIGWNSCDDMVLYDSVNEVEKPIQQMADEISIAWFTTYNNYTESLVNLN